LNNSEQNNQYQEENKGIEQPNLVPKLELPKSGGAIKGIGEKMTANPATGSANFSVPISVTAGRGAPQINISYSSGGGNGPFGMGFSMGIPRITRKTENQLPQYKDFDESDTFILSGAEDLVRKLNYNSAADDWEEETLTQGNLNIIRYRPRTEGLFARIEKITDASNGEVYWRSISGENITSIYGEELDYRIYDPKDPSRVFSWLLCKTYDSKGNVTVYNYKEEDNENVGDDLSEVQRKKNAQAQKYLKEVWYGNTVMFNPGDDINTLDFLFKVVFDYGEHDLDQPTLAEVNSWPAREDAFSNYRSGFEIRTRRLCRRVLMFHHFQGPEFGLGPEPRLITSTDFFYKENYIVSQMEAISLVSYEKESGLYIKHKMPSLDLQFSEAIVDDTIRKIKDESYDNLPQGLSGNYQFTDLNAEGLSGILIETANAWYYKRNLGEGRFDAMKLVTERPNWSTFNRGTQLSNLEANGQVYLSQVGKSGGFSKRAHNGKWSPRRNFDHNINVNLEDPKVRRLDLNGDGKPEILFLNDELLSWHENQGEAGFGFELRNYGEVDENKGPHRIFQNDLESIYLSDMSGDGLGDIIRIRNGNIAYWPNLGYGNFGEKVIMDAAPVFDSPDLFDHSRVRLGDIDGSGTTDLLYLGKNKTAFWLNQSGNSFSESTIIQSYPLTNQFTDTRLVDLLGNGTSCLVWSSPLEKDRHYPLRYIDLMSSVKPYLLIEVKNNMGSVSRTRYKPSTYYYLKDERDNKPWVTKLPFPVQLVHQTEVEDLITGHKFINEYAYHHGYYDRAEREFRGFGCVEQWDDESFKNPTETNPTQIHDKPRVHTKSWYHTGAWEREIDLGLQYESEYWNPSNLKENELLDTELWSPAETREAKRNLKGQLLRQEVYTEDDSPLKENPYVVTESRYQVKQLQPITGNNKNAVYISLPAETLTANYERNPADPRLTHEMTLDIDDFGNILSTSTIAYPRQIGTSTDPDYSPEQYKPKFIYTVNEVFNQDDNSLGWFAKGVPLSSKSYEVESWPDVFPPFFERQAVITQIDTVPQKLLSAQAHYYRPNAEANSLTPSKLPHGTVESQVLPYGSFTLVVTDEILSEAYSDILSQTEWEDHYTTENYKNESHLGINEWWVHGGFVQYDPSNFYITTKAVDAWGNQSEISYDALSLLPIRVEDAIGNVITAKYDYRILQPLEITDPNGNRSQVAYDGFGRVIRSAVMGKETENVGDILSANPRQSFNPADTDTSVIEYQHDNFYLLGKPNYVHSYIRETHHHELSIGSVSRWTEARVYSDGFGRELQSKAKVAPGDAYVVTSGTLQQVAANPRWLGSGRTVYDNKGQAVKQYEPYFSTTKDYEDEEELNFWGVSPFIHYDAVGRVIQTDMPDGTFSKVEFTPWMQKSYDALDTVKDSQWYQDRIGLPSGSKERRAADLSAVHYDTPTSQVFDVLGRPVITVQHNNDSVNGITDDKYITELILDTVGNQLQLIDARGNKAAETVYDLVGRPLRSFSNDAGTSHAILTIDNQPALSWMPRGHRTRMEYDQFRRPKYLWLQEPGSTNENIKEATIYGEDISTAPEANNMRGQVWKVYDQGGMLEMEVYDFKGIPLEVHRHLFEDYLEEGNWTGLEMGSVTLPTLDEVFTVSTKVDAQGKPILSISPDQTETRNSYDDAGALLKVEVKSPSATFKEIVKEITYNEKGQRQFIRYGNGIKTSYTYNELNYRLNTIKSLNTTTNKLLQDISYTYDAIVNIVEIEDQAQKTVYFRNNKIEAIQKFTYDGINRLVQAEGRELIGQQAGGDQLMVPTAEAGAMPFNDTNPNDAKALQSYTQKYAYDQIGNILEWKQIAAKHSYTRTYTYETLNNQLIKTKRGSTITDYNYDVAGNIEDLGNTISPIDWNFENQPSKMEFATSKLAHYRYDAGGERIRKVIIKGNIKEERIYLGSFEIFRVFQNGSLDKERTTNHIADDTGRICLIEKLTIQNEITSSDAEVYRYQLSNHLGSSGTELDILGNIISYEEYHPYGTTSFFWKSTNISQKRYRYTGKERDEESGLSYHSARYYMPWIGRWLSADPAGMVDGPCLYQYSLSNPVMLRDENGMQSEVEELESTIDDDRLGLKSTNSTYTIKKGDNFWDLENSFSLPHGSLQKVNPTLDPKKLKIGQGINLLDPELKNAIENTSVNVFEEDNYSIRSQNLPLYNANWMQFPSVYSEFSQGYGPENSVFLDNHYATKELRDFNNDIKRLRFLVYDKFNGDAQSLIDFANANENKVYTEFKSHQGSFMPWEERGGASQFVGSFSADVFLSEDKKNLIFVISDQKTKESLYLHLPFISNKEREEGVEGNQEANTFQKYIWKEDMNLDYWSAEKPKRGKNGSIKDTSIIPPLNNTLPIFPFFIGF